MKSLTALMTEGNYRLELEREWRDRRERYLKDCVGRGDYVSGEIASEGALEGFINIDDDWLSIGYAVFYFNMEGDDNEKKRREIEFIIETGEECLFKKKRRMGPKFIEKFIELKKESLRRDFDHYEIRRIFEDMDKLGFKGFEEDDQRNLRNHESLDRVRETLGYFSVFLERERPKLHKLYVKKMEKIYGDRYFFT